MTQCRGTFSMEIKAVRDHPAESSRRNPAEARSGLTLPDSAGSFDTISVDAPAPLIENHFGENVFALPFNFKRGFR